MHMLRLVTVVLAFTCAAFAFPEARRPESPPPAPGQVRDAPARGTLSPAGTASISGAVVASLTGQPVSGARVSVSGPQLGGSITASTTAEGRFVFTALRAGQYYLNVSKPGYVNITYGQRRPGTAARPLRLAEGETRTVAMQLPRGGVITGMVVDERGDPVLNVHVRAVRASTGPLRGPLQQAGGATTDDRGVYRVHSLQPGDYAVCTAHRNYGMPSDRQRIEAEIEGMRRSAAAAAGAVTGMTQQQMKARIATLEAQLPNHVAETGYATSCFPDMAGGSTLLAVGPDDERTGVDLQLQPARVARIEGALLGMPPEGSQSIQAILVNADENMGGWDTFHSGIAPDGRFRFYGVPPGRYTLMASTMPQRPMGPMSSTVIRGGRGGGPPVASSVASSAAEPMLWGAARIDVSGEDLTHLAIELQRGLSMSGQVVFHATTAQPPHDLSGMRVTLSPNAGAAPMLARPSQTTTDSKGQFTIPDLFPGTYTFSAALGGSSGWILASVTIDGHDVLDEPLDLRSGQSVRGAVVTFTDQQAEVSGVAFDDKGQPASDHVVLLYPAEEKYRRAPSRRLRTTLANADGTFTFRMLLPGEYRLVAVSDVPPNGPYESGVLEQLDTMAARVMLHAGEKKVQNARVSSMP